MPEVRTCAALLCALLAAVVLFPSCGTVDGDASNTENRPAGTTASAPAYVAVAKDRRWTIFRADSKEFADWKQTNDLVKSVTRIGAGPANATVIAPDGETIDGFLKREPGFVVQFAKGRLWIFREGSADLAEYQQSGEPAKSVTLLGYGSVKTTMRSGDRETIVAFVESNPSMLPDLMDGRLWLLR